MYTRVTTFEAKDIEAVEAELDTIAEKISKIDGVLSMTTAWTGEGKGISMAVYESAEAAEAAQSHVVGIWGGIMEHLAGMPVSTEYERGRKFV